MREFFPWWTHKELDEVKKPPKKSLEKKLASKKSIVETYIKLHNAINDSKWYKPPRPHPARGLL